MKIIPENFLSIISISKMKFNLRSERRFYNKLFSAKKGIEIGGPSLIFGPVLDVYLHADRVDGVNFSTKTIWEGSIIDEGDYTFNSKRLGRQFIRDATNLEGIISNSYDFLISSNCLEHIANPIKAIKEWGRVIKPSGLMLLIVPNHQNNFDHLREITKFDHIVDDFVNDVAESDMTHLDEILAKHDLSLDPGSINKTNFEMRCKMNSEYRGMHHHVFDIDLLCKITSHLGMDVIHSKETPKDLFVLVRQKIDQSKFATH